MSTLGPISQLENQAKRLSTLNIPIIMLALLCRGEKAWMRYIEMAGSSRKRLVTVGIEIWIQILFVRSNCCSLG